MTCTDVREALLELPLARLHELAPHLHRCPQCRALAAAVRDAHDRIGDELDDFAHCGDFDAAFAEAAGAIPLRPPTRWRLHTMLTVAAALALAALVLSQRPLGEVDETPPVELRPEVRTSASPEVPLETDGGTDEHSTPAALPGSGPADRRTAPLGDDRSADRAPVAAPLSVGEPEAPPPATTAPARGEPVTCGSLPGLTAIALTGRLSSATVACLEAALREPSPQDDRVEISQALMANAWASGNGRAWAELAERHLHEVAPDDADAAYKLSVYFASRLPERADDVIRWTGVAMQHRTVWKGEVYVERVLQLYKLASAARLSIWQELERGGAATDADLERLENARAATEAAASEWAAYARAAGRPARRADRLCRTAAGDGARERCGR